MSVPVVTVSSGGKKLGTGLAILSLEIRKEVDRVPEARLVVHDGSIASRKFELSDAPTFEPGAEVVIEIREEAASERDTQLFRGLVVRHAVESRDEGSELRIELRDPAIVLTRRRRSAVHREQTDDDIVRAMLDKAKLEPGTIDAGDVTHAALVQYNTTDWDFLASRADINGQLIVVDDGTVSLRSLAKPGEVVARFAHGLDEIFEVELELDASDQWAAAESLAWDAAEQAPTEAAEADDMPATVGKFDVAEVATKLGGDRLTLVLPGSAAAEELAPWASARLARSRLALCRGRLVVPGRADILPFDRIELEGLGQRFAGPLLVSAVIQHYDRDGWRTELRLGLSPEWFARAPGIADVPAGGLVPPIAGLQVGLVHALADDPQGEHRVEVMLPAFNDKDTAVWARVARPDAGKDRGIVFWPEVGDEVVVGFLADDPRQAIVLGSLHGAKNTPPKPALGPTDDNNHRAIVSKSGTTIAFDDEKKSLTLTTPGNNKIVIDDDAKSITLADEHGNTFTLDKHGITLKSAKDLKIDAAGKIEIKGTSVDIQ